MTTPTALQPDMSKALALLLAGYTITEAASLTNFPAGPLRKLASGQKGWLIDENGRAYDPSQPGYRPQAPDSVALADIRWAAELKKGTATVVPLPAAQRPTTAAASAAPPKEPTPVGPQLSDDTDVEIPKKVDALLARAAEWDDRQVRRALRAAVNAINVLDDQVETAEQRKEAELAREREREQAVTAVLEAQRQLAEAKARAKRLGVKVPRGKQAPPPEAPAAEAAPVDTAGRDPDKWAPGREPAATPARRYSPGVDSDPKAVREWAAGEGLAFPRNGRFLPGPLVQEYLDAHPQQAAS